MNLYELTQFIDMIDKNIFRRWEFFIIIILALIGGLIAKGGKMTWSYSLILICSLGVTFFANGIAIKKNVKSIQVVEAQRRAILIKYEERQGFKDLTPEFREYIKSTSAVYHKWSWLYIFASIAAIIVVIFHTDLNF
jgi:hypothetical protein